MVRPAKNPEERKGYHLRVPLAAKQRTLIEEAARLADEDKATWARTVLLAAARKRIAQRQKDRVAADEGDCREEKGSPTQTGCAGADQAERIVLQTGE
jgi:hypothetical protein